MAKDRPGRKAAAGLATDVIGHGTHIENEKSLTIRTYRSHKANLFNFIGNLHGRGFQNIGGSVVAAFASGAEVTERPVVSADRNEQAKTYICNDCTGCPSLKLSVSKCRNYSFCYEWWGLLNVRRSY